MKIKIINPAVDIPDEFISGSLEYLKKYLKHDTEIEFEDIKKGFRSVETEAQGIINGAEAVKVMMSLNEEEYDGVFINCFDDPAVIAGRELLHIPVFGPYEVSVMVASLLSERVAILSTDDYGIICEERKKKAHGTWNRIYKIENLGLSVLELANNKLVDKIVQKAFALEKEGVGAVVFGCTGMNYMAEAIQGALREKGSNLKVVEPLRTGITMLEYVISQGWDNSISSTPIEIQNYII